MAAATHSEERSDLILVTGFAAFPGAPVNPTQALMSRLARVRRPALRPVCHLLPVTWADGPGLLETLVERHKPAAIVMFGLAARADCIRIEVRARNAAERLRVDAAGQMHPTGFLAAGPTGHRRVDESTVLRATQALRLAGVPARRSHDAGTYLCNAVLWSALKSAGPGTPVLFVHVPKLGRYLPMRPGARRRARRRLDAEDLVRAATRILMTVKAGAKRLRAGSQTRPAG